MYEVEISRVRSQFNKCGSFEKVVWKSRDRDSLHDIPSAIVAIPSVEISSGAFAVGFASNMVHPKVVSPIA